MRGEDGELDGSVCDGQMETPPVGLLCIDVCSDCAKMIDLLKEFEGARGRTQGDKNLNRAQRKDE